MTGNAGGAAGARSGARRSEPRAPRVGQGPEGPARSSVACRCADGCGRTRGERVRDARPVLRPQTISVGREERVAAVAGRDAAPRRSHRGTSPHGPPASGPGKAGRASVCTAQCGGPRRGVSWAGRRCWRTDARPRLRERANGRPLTGQRGPAWTTLRNSEFESKTWGCRGGAWRVRF